MNELTHAPFCCHRCALRIIAARWAKELRVELLKGTLTREHVTSPAPHSRDRDEGGGFTVAIFLWSTTRWISAERVTHAYLQLSWTVEMMCSVSRHWGRSPPRWSWTCNSQCRPTTASSSTAHNEQRGPWLQFIYFLKSSLHAEIWRLLLRRVFAISLERWKYGEIKRRFGFGEIFVILDYQPGWAIMFMHRQVALRV